MTNDRDKLIRECFQRNREIGYRWFRGKYFTDAEAIAEWPDPRVREQELRKVWDQLSAKSFPAYAQSWASRSLAELENHLLVLRETPAHVADRYVRNAEIELEQTRANVAEHDRGRSR
jgi:hypothetical protein